MSMPNPEPSPAAPPPAAAPGAPSPYSSPAPYGPPPGSPGYAFSPQPASPARTDGKALGAAAIILGAIPLLMGLIQPFTTRLMLGSGNGYAYYSAVMALIAILNLALGVAALVCGLAARRRAPLLGGIGIGLGAATIVGVLSSFVYAIPFLGY